MPDSGSMTKIFHSHQLWHLYLRFVSVDIKSEDLVVIYFDRFLCLVRQIFSTELVFVMPSEFWHRSLNLRTLITFLFSPWYKKPWTSKSYQHHLIITSVALSELFFSCRQPSPVSSLPPAMRRRSFSHINICTFLCTYGSLSAGREFWLINVTF